MRLLQVQYPVNDWLTYGTLSYPACFLITNLTNRCARPRVSHARPTAAESSPSRSLVSLFL